MHRGAIGLIAHRAHAPAAEGIFQKATGSLFFFFFFWSETENRAVQKPSFDELSKSLNYISYLLEESNLKRKRKN